MKRLTDLARKIKRTVTGDFLTRANGLIHIGANSGQERELYNSLNLDVIWLEPIPDVFAQLTTNIAPYTRQKAYQHLVTDQDDKDYVFNVANNGVSSSILKLKEHKDIWPDVSMEKQITVKSITLDTLVKRENIDLTHYNALLLDTQGSELLVLKGAVASLPKFRYVKAEAADFEAYEGGCQLKDLEPYLQERQFREIDRDTFAERAAGGAYYDITYENTNL